MNLSEFTSWLLDEANPSDWVQLADQYIQTYNKLGKERFVLPNIHSKLKILIEIFANDRKGFVEYIKGVRDASHAAVKSDIHKIYRTILTRDLQAARRVRLNRVVDLYESTHGKLKYSDRLAYMGAVEKAWGKERLAYMKAYRLGKKRLSLDEQANVLDDFWAIIDKKIDEGILPHV